MVQLPGDDEQIAQRLRASAPVVDLAVYMAIIATVLDIFRPNMDVEALRVAERTGLLDRLVRSRQLLGRDAALAYQALQQCRTELQALPGMALVPTPPTEGVPIAVLVNGAATAPV